MEATIREIFDLFDHERNKTIDFRELGTVIRALGGVPTEAEVISLVREVSFRATKNAKMKVRKRPTKWLY